MKIVYLTAGAANMYCGTCLHDNALATKLIELGHDVLLTPLYTPTRTDEPNVSGSHVFFSGINVYLQQKSWLFRHTPRLVDRIFESRWILNRLAGRASAVAPEKLGDLTVSMLRGEEGRQAKELAKLVEWLAVEQPDIVHLSNSLLLGAAREIRRVLSVPVVCSLSGEDLFLEHIPPPHYDQAREALRDRSCDVDVFVSMNGYYADFMAEYLDVERGRVEVIRHGLKIEHYPTGTHEASDDIPTVGYLARVCEDKGLHLLVDAAKELVRQRGRDVVRIRAAGYVGALDRPYLDAIIKNAAREPAIDFEYVGELDLADKVRFLGQLDAMALPTVYHESKGISAIEALAVGTPVIVPSHGVFPELVEDTGGGVLFDAGDPGSLAESLGQHLDAPAKALERGERGRAAVQDRYSDLRMAEETFSLYEKLLARKEGVGQGLP
ncbi:MAG: glycosyltransferase family 4 protein [Pirellulales bacterium]|nr:glycosyltransferase family 4 protein [Pirellulales bacterium]